MENKNITQLKIPAQFHSDLDNAPISQCLMCKKELHHPGTIYMIEKVVQVKKSNNTATTIFEHAICFSCSMKKKQSLSADSLQNIERYFSNHTNLLDRSREFVENDVLDPGQWLNDCAVKGKKMSECTEYQIFCLCNGDKLDPSILPYMICDEAIEEINELISPQTKEELDDLIDEYYGFPPEYKELLNSKKLIFV